MNYRNFFSTAFLFISTSAYSVTPYIEGQIGYAGIIGDAETERISGTASAYGQTYTYTNLGLDLEYHSDVGFGVEIGGKAISDTNLRVGVSYNTYKFDLNKVKVAGTIANATESYSNLTADGDVFQQDFGVDMDNRAKIYSTNIYYDFNLSENLKPFLGVGLGIVDIENVKDNEFALSASAGGKYYFNKKVYLGAKASYINVNGPKDKLDVSYEDIELYSANLILGYEF
jgi:opacity protein-like surface antigen